MITTHVTIAAGFSTISATPTRKPDHISSRAASRCALFRASSLGGGSTGGAGWLRAVMKPYTSSTSPLTAYRIGGTIG